MAGAGLLRGVPLRESLSAGVNLAVASVPEGRPFLVNGARLAAARRLADRGALVRNPRSIEALGRVDVLCFDKTGTLIEGRLTVSEIDDGQHRCRIDALRDTSAPGARGGAAGHPVRRRPGRAAARHRPRRAGQRRRAWVSTGLGAAG